MWDVGCWLGGVLSILGLGDGVVCACVEMGGGVVLCLGRVYA